MFAGDTEEDRLAQDTSDIFEFNIQKQNFFTTPGKFGGK